jgi:hypothetical protein
VRGDDLIGGGLKSDAEFRLWVRGATPCRPRPPWLRWPGGWVEFRRTETGVEARGDQLGRVVWSHAVEPPADGADPSPADYLPLTYSADGRSDTTPLQGPKT